MIIKKDNGKLIMELTDENLIINRLFRKEKLQRNSIRSAFLAHDTLYILTKDNSVESLVLARVSWKERERIKIIINEINKENIIFWGDYYSNPFTFLCCIPAIITNILPSNVMVMTIFIVIFVIFSYFVIKYGYKYSGVIYDVSMSKFQRLHYNGKVEKRILYI